MFAVTNKPEMGARLASSLIHMATDSNGQTDGMKLIQHLAGVLAESYFIFDEPGQAMEGGFAQLSRLLGCEALSGPLWPAALPPAHIIDHETERGRVAARLILDEWMDCLHELQALIQSVAHHMIVSWEAEGVPREESFRLVIECTRRAMSFEIAAQELCDLVIERKVALEGWSLGDCIAGLSAIAGRRLAQSLNSDTCMIFRGCNIPDNLDRAVYVMTQEAVRMGVPAGSDWRFGLAANDMPVNAPVELIRGLEPCCQEFFTAMEMDGLFDQAVSCAKAAGRMIAVAAGGELPEIEPAIAKPLAMAAMTESYKFVCLDQALATA